MGEPRSSSHTSTTSSQSSPTTLPSPPPPPQKISLIQPSQKRKHRPKVVRVFRSVFRSLPIITPTCKFPSIPTATAEGHHHHHHRNIAGHNGTKVSGTLFGHRKGRVSLSIQENPKCLPSLVIELSMQTNVLQKEMAAGMVRIALECEKRGEKDKTLLTEEPLWTMYCNGKKTGYGVKREASEEDLNIMELLKAVSMGAGVVPMKNEADDVDGELAFMRASFEHVIGSKDSETLYMLSPDGNNNNGPELTIFFVRI
ncbi:protein MIZU-KUSSEI 1 [Cicer arietinum]|uniref:Protein MIZU-KUSSEI 1 n=1 Tax=Cicer arietinum TaxID=3827 RepID=A0A1S2YCM5_CICAR|nr:protein MIZU-KUSSEI 1 [Cicer arietinum]